MLERDLDLWIENDLNVLFQGRHGVGKTAIIKKAFDKHKLNWKYFSAATMDPWVDFVGIPKTTTDDNGNDVLDLVRPRGFHDDTVEAIFMDELNRAPKKVRNAVMELIQFKTINGVSFPNLRFIWAAINPDDEESDLKYDVEELDPAQKDRFHICIDVPYKPDYTYFSNKHGIAGEGAIEWWESLNNEQQGLVSPRRLDYALDVNAIGGSVRHVLTDKTLNTSKLITSINAGSIKKKLKTLFKNGTGAEKTEMFSDINFVTNALPKIYENTEYIAAFAEFIPNDILSGDIFIDGKRTAHSKKIAKRIIDYAPESITHPILKSVVNTGIYNSRGLKGVSNFLGIDVAGFLVDGSVGKPPQPGSFNESLMAYYKETNLCIRNSTNQRIEALEYVTGRVERDLDNSDESLIACLMLVSAVIARTQSATLARGAHAITMNLVSIIESWKFIARTRNVYIGDMWINHVRPELKRSSPNKKHVVGKGKGKVFNIGEIEKIEDFLGV